MSFFYEVNPANVAEIRGRFNLGEAWNPRWSSLDLVNPVRGPDFVNNFYPGVEDPNPPPPPTGRPTLAYVQQINPSFVGGVNNPQAFVQENISWVARDLDELLEIRQQELREHAVGILYDECRLTGLGGVDFWVPMSEVAQAVDNGHDARINRAGWPPNGIQKRLTRIDTERRMDVDLTESQWNDYVVMRDDHFLDQLEKAVNKVDERLLTEYEQGDLEGLDAVNVRVRWSPSTAATYQGPRIFDIEGDQTAFFVRGTQVECRQPSGWLWGRVEVAIHLGGITTVTLDFRDNQELVNEAFDVSVDLWRYPEWRAWIPGSDDSRVVG